MISIENFSLERRNGQTAVEYLLLLLVLVTIITSILFAIRNKYVGRPEKCFGPNAEKTFICKIIGFLGPGTGNRPFQYFPFKK